MSRTADDRVADILEAISRSARYIEVLAKHEHDPDIVSMAEDALERNLQIIGEAAKHLPESLTSAHPEVPWPQIRGFRNILVHQYFGVDADVVRDVVEAHLPPLAKALRQYVTGG